MKNGNLSSLSKSFKTNIPSHSVFVLRSKDIACVPLCPGFSSDGPGYMHLKDVIIVYCAKVIYKMTNSMVFYKLKLIFQKHDFNILISKK